MTVVLKQKKKTHSDGAGQGLLPFSPIHSGLRVAEEIRNADIALEKNRKRRQAISSVKPAPEERCELLTLFEVPEQMRKGGVRLPSKDVLVEVKPQVGKALGLLEETARYFAIKYVTLARATTAVLDKQESWAIERQILTSEETGKKFKHPHGGTVTQTWSLLNNAMKRCRERGPVSQQEDYGKLCGASAAFACMCKAMKAYWLLKEAGTKPFLEYAAELRTRKAKVGPRSGKPKRSQSDMGVRKHAKYVEAYKIIFEMTGKNWRARPEMHGKMARIVGEAVGEARKGGRVLIYAKLNGTRIGRAGKLEMQLSEEIKRQIEERRGEERLGIAVAGGASKLPKGDILIATEFLKFEKIDAADPSITLILQYDKIARRGKDKSEKYPARQLVLMSKVH